MSKQSDKTTKKRKCEDFIFEVGDADCSPASTPEPETSKLPDTMEETSDNVSPPASNLQILEDTEAAPKTQETDENSTEISETDAKPCLPDDEMSISEPEDTETDEKPQTKPLITLIFHDEELSSKYTQQITSYIERLITCKANHKQATQIDFYELEKAQAQWTEMFVVDTTPSKPSTYYPLYQKNHNVSLDTSENPDDQTEKCTPQNISCFNCGGPHTLNDCREKRDYRKIRMARNKMRTKPVRYHLESEQRFGHLVPGNISDKLKRALDVRKDELPPYVYRMRTLGYPPGWLEEAKVENSSMDLFDFQGAKVSVKQCGTMYNRDKIIEYPGFNVPCEKSVKDEYRKFRCPAFSAEHSKQAMIDFIDRMHNTTETEEKPSPETPETQAEDSNSNPNALEITAVSTMSMSPTLTDLEMRKTQLLAELLDGATSSPILPSVGSSAVKSVSYGTPIVKSASPYSRLPDADSFSKDITQVINFENLPDSTGKYEQMSKVIDRVRKVREESIT